MKTYRQYVLQRESHTMHPSGMELDNGFSGDKESTLNTLIKMAWDRYEGETKQFLERLAQKDPEIKDQLETLSSGKTAPNKGEKEIIAMPISDSPEADDV